MLREQDLATFISNCIACLYFFVLLYIKRGNTFVSVNPKKFRFDRAIAIEVFRVGIPASIQNLLNVTGMTILNNFTAGYGSDAVAAMGIAQKLNQIPMQIALGMSQGVMPLYSYTYASKNYTRMRKSVLFTIRISLSFALIVSVGYFIFSEQLVTLFMDNPDIVAYGSRFLHGMCLGIVFLSTDFTAVGIFQATGQGEKAFILCDTEKDCTGNPGAVHFELAVPAVRTCLRAIHCGSCSCCYSRHRCCPDVQETGRPEFSPPNKVNFPLSVKSYTAKAVPSSGTAFLFIIQASF